MTRCPDCGDERCARWRAECGGHLPDCGEAALCLIRQGVQWRMAADAERCAREGAEAANAALNERLRCFRIDCELALADCDDGFLGSAKGRLSRTLELDCQAAEAAKGKA